MERHYSVGKIKSWNKKAFPLQVQYKQQDILVNGNLQGYKLK